MRPLRSSLVVLAVLAALAAAVQAYPSWSRQKRVSDQRLAELETLLALARLKGRMLSVPVGYGFIDPAKIGRKKRLAQRMEPIETAGDDVLQDADETDDVTQLWNQILNDEGDYRSIQSVGSRRLSDRRRRR